MNKLRILVVSGAMLLSHAGPGWPQAQHLLRVKVVNEFDRPLPGISFRIAFVGDYRSDPNGEREIMLPAGKGPGQRIEFELKNDSLAIFEPARGRDKVPDRDAIILKLLRLGDHRLLNREEMKVLMNKLISEATKKGTQRLLAAKTQLEQQLASAPQDPLAEDAKRLGFSKEELLAAIEKVKAQLQESENSYDVGLAALYDKHYGKAAQLIEQAITAAEKKIQEGNREEELLPKKYLNLGNARAGEFKFKEAVSAYEKAIALQPSDGDAYVLLGNALYIMGDLKGMMKILKKSLVIFRSQNLGRLTLNESVALSNLGATFITLNQLDSARVYSQAALKIVREIGNRQLETILLGNYVVGFIIRGMPDSAHVYFQAALKIAREIGNRKLETILLGNYVVGFIIRGMPDSAHVYFQAELKIAREIGNRQLEASVLYNYVFLSNIRGLTDSARVYSQVALKFARENGDREVEVLLLCMAGVPLPNIDLESLNRRALDSTRVYYEAVLKITREIGFRFGEVVVFRILGVIFEAIKKPDSARVYYQTALKIAGQIGDHRNEISLLTDLAELYKDDLSMPDSARVYYQTALKSAGQIGDYRNEISFLTDLAELYKDDLSMPDSARVYYQTALKIAGQIGDHRNEISLLTDLAELYKDDLSMPDSARVYYQAALKIAGQIGDYRNEISFLTDLAELYKDDLSMPDSARVYFQSALKIAGQIGDHRNEISILIELAELCKGDLNMPDNARVYYQTALKIAGQIGDYRNEISLLTDLAELYKDDLSMPDSARVYFQSALKIINEIVDSPFGLVFRSLVQPDSTFSLPMSMNFHKEHFLSRAFIINRKMLQLDSTDTSLQAKFAENHFTTGRFAECEKRLAALLANSQVEPSTKTALHAIVVANLLALDKHKQVPTQLNTLQTTIASQPDTFKVGWTFEGTKHFIGSEPKLARYREWLLQLFQALEIKEGREAILAALRVAREEFSTVGKKD